MLSKKLVFKKSDFIIILSILIISTLHYFTPVGKYFNLHSIYQRLYYIPVIFAAYYYGCKKGFFYGLLSGILYAPHIFFQWHAHPEDSFTKYVEIIMFVVVSIVVGILSDKQKIQTQKLIDATRKMGEMNRLNLLGQLSAGLAHEIRNPLASIIGSVEIIKDSVSDDNKNYEFIEIMEKELNRLKRKLDEFLNFAKPHKPEKIFNNLNDVVRGALALTEKSAIKQNIKIVTELDENISESLMDSELIKEVLINLIVNSINAIKSNGTIIIKTGVEDKNLFFVVKDDGEGFNNIEDVNKIFEPFFTTRVDGTGLGLAIVKEIVTALNGNIEAYSDKSGAIFKVSIPYDR